MRQKHRLFLLGGLVAGAVALGCQAAPTTAPAAPRSTIRVGAIQLDPATDLAIEYTRNCGEAQAGYGLKQAIDPRIVKFKLKVTGTSIIDPIEDEVTVASFLGGCVRTTEIADLPPGTYTVLMNGVDASGKPISSGTNTMTLVAGGPALVIPVKCDFTTGKVSVEITCCSPSPSAPASTSPSPTATPTSAPTATPTPTPTPTPIPSPLDPADIAVDQFGNVWTPNFLGDDVTKFDPMGNILAHYPAGDGAFSLAFENSGTLWVADWSGKLTHLAPDGSFLGEVPIGGTPLRIRLDPQNNLWVAIFGTTSRSVKKFDSSGALLDTFTIGANTAGGANPHSIAFDATGSVWITGVADNSITKMALSGTPKAAYTSGLDAPWGVAIDSQGNAWVSNLGNTANSVAFENTVAKFSPTGALLGNFDTRDPLKPTANDGPTAVLVDPDDDVWIACYNSGTVTRLSPDGSFKAKYKVGIRPQSLALGKNNDVWVANRTSNSITRLPR